MDTNELKLNQEVQVKQDNKVIKGSVKGFYEDCSGKVKVRVEYMVPEQYDFDIEQISKNDSGESGVK